MCYPAHLTKSSKVTQNIFLPIYVFIISRNLLKRLDIIVKLFDTLQAMLFEEKSYRI